MTQYIISEALKSSQRKGLNELKGAQVWTSELLESDALYYPNPSSSVALTVDHDQKMDP